MKKTILALTIPALFATSASAVTVYSDEGAKVDLYGRIQYEAGSFKHEGADRQKFGGEGEARLGVNVQYNLNQDVDLIGKLEWQAVAEEKNATGTDSLKSRYAWAGFRFMDTTDLTFGKSENPTAQLTDVTDIFNIFGGAASFNSLDDAGISSRIDDQIRVSFADQGIDLRAGYAFHDENKTRVAGEKQKNQYSLSAGYTFPFNLGLVAAYERQNYDLLVGEADLDVWGLGANYSIDGFYFGTVYGQKDLDATGEEDYGTRFWELVATYNVDAWTLMAGYNYEKERKVGAGESKDKLVNEYVLGVQYALTPKTKLYGEYNIQRTKVADERKDDLYAVGIQYNF
ncbi:porin [Zobellella denitrificans]|uniref:porin n=1 Tax=Zobellella denitrificans TaxID=347534 RepID=UPI000B8BD4BA|nr:porin [Zobellella denitrificans]OXS16935.1 porin [Zobellella denitrificans]